MARHNHQIGAAFVHGPQQHVIEIDRRIMADQRPGGGLQAKFLFLRPAKGGELFRVFVGVMAQRSRFGRGHPGIADRGRELPGHAGRNLQRLVQPLHMGQIDRYHHLLEHHIPPCRTGPAGLVHSGFIAIARPFRAGIMAAPYGTCAKLTAIGL